MTHGCEAGFGRGDTGLVPLSGGVLEQEHGAGGERSGLAVVHFHLEGAGGA